MWNVRDVGCSECGMFKMWNVGCGMFGLWNVRDVGCSGCGMFEMWDVLIYEVASHYNNMFKC